MGPGIGVRGRAASATPKVTEVFACEAFKVTRESRDRYKLTDALSVSIRSAAEIETLFRQRMSEAAQARVHYAQAHEALRRVSEHGDTPPPAELIRRVQAVAPLRIVPPLPVIEDKPAAPPGVKRAPQKGTMKNRSKKKPMPVVFVTEPANDNVLHNVPHKRDEPAPRRRTGGMSYLKLLASQELIEEPLQHATAV
jgi:hypothetical protein